jgi:lipopolysaccharide biosynthesis regulator YciM
MNFMKMVKMMIIDKYWLEREMRQVELCFKKEKIKKRDTRIMIKLMLFGLSLLIAGYVSGDDVICPHCDNVVVVEVKAEGRPGYWKCRKCGYWNLEGIWRCPCCGTLKGDK